MRVVPAPLRVAVPLPVTIGTTTTTASTISNTGMQYYHSSSTTSTTSATTCTSTTASSNSNTTTGCCSVVAVVVVAVVVVVVVAWILSLSVMAAVVPNRRALHDSSCPINCVVGSGSRALWHDRALWPYKLWRSCPINCPMVPYKLPYKLQSCPMARLCPMDL